MRKSVIHSLVMGAASLALALACSPAPSGDDSTETGGTNSGGSKSGGASSGGSKPTGGAAAGGSSATGGGAMGGSCGEAIGDSAENAGFTVGATVYSYSDEAGSCITGTLADGEACVHGTAAQVVDDRWSEIWGAGLGINLVDPDGAVDLSAYDGFSFNFSGTLPAELRVSVALVGNTDSFFTTTLADGANSVSFADLAQGSWVAAPVDFDASQASKIQFQIPATNAGPVSFDFCISDVELTGAGGAGGAGGATL